MDDPDLALLTTPSTASQPGDAGLLGAETCAGTLARALPQDLRWLARIQATADRLVALSLDAGAARGDTADLLREAATAAGVPEPTVALLALAAAARDPIFERAAPVEAADSLLRLLFLLAPVRKATLWITTPRGALHAVAHLGGSRPTRAAHDAAGRAFSGWLPDGRESAVRCLPLRRSDDVVGVLTFRPHADQHDRATVSAELLVDPLVSILVRAPALEQAPRRQRQAVAAAARRLRRVGFDLHDGPLQSAALLHGEIALFQSQLGNVVEPPEKNRLLQGRFDDLRARTAELQEELREIAASCTEDAVPRLPLDARLRDLVARFRSRGAIAVSLQLAGDFDGLSPSQELALFHIVQEALSNIREHSDARVVGISARAEGGSVEAQVVDDGRGFDVARTVEAAGDSRRLGLAGMVERARLLGGTVTIDSAVGQSTTITIDLPAWRPLPEPRRLRSI